MTAVPLPLARTGLRLLLVIVLAFAAAGRGLADEPGVGYGAHVEGVPDSGLRKVLGQVSALMTRVKQKPPSIRALERRAQDDEEDLRKVLESEGYYDGSVHVRFDDEKKPLEAVIETDLGPRYAVAGFDVQFADEQGAPPRDLIGRKGVLLPEGSPARAEDILNAKARLLDALRGAGYPLAKVAGETYEVDRTTRRMQVHWSVDHGGPWRFGPATIEGAPGVDAGFLGRKVT